jgi:hypothetical protein
MKLQKAPFVSLEAQRTKVSLYNRLCTKPAWSLVLGRLGVDGQ